MTLLFTLLRMATMQKMLIHNSKVQASELRKVWLLRCEQLAGMVVPDLIKMQEVKVPNSFQKERSHSVGCRVHANCTCDVYVQHELRNTPEKNGPSAGLLWGL